MNIRFRLDGFTDEMQPLIEFYGNLGTLYYKNFRLYTNEDGTSTREYVISSANPTIKKMTTVQIVDENGKDINLEVFNPIYVDMGNGHKFIAGKVLEQPVQYLLLDSPESK